MRGKQPTQVGKKYGNIAVIGVSEKRTICNKILYVVQCDCGRIYDKYISISKMSENSCCMECRRPKWGKTNSNKSNTKPRTKYSITNKKESSLKTRFHSYLSGARARNIEFDLSLDVFEGLTALPCTYCGDFEMYSGVDRVNNSLGYTLSNSTPCCKVCNVWKSTMTTEQFKRHIIKLSEHLKLNEINCTKILRQRQVNIRSVVYRWEV